MGNKAVYHRVTIWQMFRDIFVTAINRGQLLGVILGLLLVILLLRLPTADLAVFTRNVIENLKNGYLLGYLLFIITLGLWFFHAKHLRRKAFQEQERIGLEKSELQKVALPGKVKSSRRR